MRTLTLFIAFGFVTSGWTSAARAELPNQPAMAEEDATGTRIMVGWSQAPSTAPGISSRQTPDNPAFTDAELFHFTSTNKRTDAAVITAFEKAGMSGPVQIAKTRLHDAGVDVLDSHPDAQGHAVMVEGTIDSKPAYGIAISVHFSLGDDDRKTGVHAFMAPTDIFEALGGHAIVAAQWFYASAEPDEDMRNEGSLPPQAATNRAALFFNKWLEAYLIPMLGMTLQMQMQSIQQMASWNNAMAACAGEASCTVTQDGVGNWSATIE